jgi:hypothetical protein
VGDLLEFKGFAECVSISRLVGLKVKLCTMWLVNCCYFDES